MSCLPLRCDRHSMLPLEGMTMQAPISAGRGLCVSWLFSRWWTAIEWLRLRLPLILAQHRDLWVLQLTGLFFYAA